MPQVMFAAGNVVEGLRLKGSFLSWAFEKTTWQKIRVKG